MSKALNRILGTVSLLVATSLVGAELPTEPDGVRHVFADTLKSGGQGPAMVVIPAGRFSMGCRSDCRYSEEPVHEVVIPEAFALSVHEMTFEDYDRFKRRDRVADESWGRGRRPVINVSWDDAMEYVVWLSSQTGAEYRLPSEAEWEYAARAGSVAKYAWGNEVGSGKANCAGCGSRWDGRVTAPVGSFASNGWGLHDMHGNVFEWVEDCWNDSYEGAPSDGSAWLEGECVLRVSRGGSWGAPPRALRAAYRGGSTTGYRSSYLGFRVARTLNR
ncbi:MAG: formylglycine-generating enzyme family protein [Gammaproteobacteria bacterium]|nr:formylglycine-generating enzyme family protein [Gammaproteobacteria bacterium]